MTSEPTAELVSAGMSHVEFGIPGVTGGVVRIALLEDAEAMRAEVVRGLKVATYVREKWAGTFPEPEQTTENTRSDTREQVRTPAPAGSAAVVFNAANEPCCPQHKTREGFPRPMKDWGERFACTAKKKDGTYCTNEYRR